jgi:hypothetical protein
MKNKKEQIKKLKFALSCIDKQLNGIKKEYLIIRREIKKLDRAESKLCDKYNSICEKLAKLEVEA